MVSVTSASRYITSASRYHPHYQSRSSMNIRGLYPHNFVELAGTGLIESTVALGFAFIVRLDGKDPQLPLE